MGSGGGGGGSTTSYSGIDPEFKPYLEDVLADVTKRYKADVETGPDAIVAELDPRQKAALDSQTALARQAITGQGVYNTEEQAKRLIQRARGASQQGMYGKGQTGYGTARQERALETAMLDKGLDLAEKRQETARMGVSELGKAGTTLQQYAQSRLDAPHTSAQRYFGYLGSAPQRTETTQSGGGK